MMAEETLSHREGQSMLTSTLGGSKECSTAHHSPPSQLRAGKHPTVLCLVQPGPAAFEERLQPTGVVLGERKMLVFTGAGYGSGRGAPCSHWISSGARAQSASSPGWLLAPRLHTDTQHAATTAFHFLEECTGPDS